MKCGRLSNKNFFKLSCAASLIHDYVYILSAYILSAATVNITRFSFDRTLYLQDVISLMQIIILTKYPSPTQNILEQRSVSQFVAAAKILYLVSYDVIITNAIG